MQESYHYFLFFIIYIDILLIYANLEQPKKVMKKVITPLLSAAIFFGGLFIESNARADDDKAPTEKPTKKKSGFYPFRGIIKSVDAKKNTISLAAAKGKPDRVFMLVKDAKVKLDGETTELSEIKAGMFVGGRAKRVSEKLVEAHTVNVLTKAPIKRKPKKKQEKEEKEDK